jgi:formylglycine-generating enzyme required for sulfatase activity
MIAAALLSAPAPVADPTTTSGTERLCGSYAGLPAADGVTANMVRVSGGTFAMGSDTRYPEERYTHAVHVDDFWIDRHEVTNAQFKRFVDATGYVTLAERGPDFRRHAGLTGDLAEPGSVLFVAPTTFNRDLSQWWRYVKGANWREPSGPGSTSAGMENRPVVHITYGDALAYAHWLGRELPTEAQWEFAARGGAGSDVPDWTSAFGKDGKPIANTWQGVFPVYDTGEDGYGAPAPVGCFPPNGYGLYDMIGNVWEWTTDWYRPGHPRGEADNPAGPNLLEVRLAKGQMPSKVIKGGSYLCSSNYCGRYRPAARQPQELDLSAGHVGFRTVLNVPDQ